MFRRKEIAVAIVSEDDGVKWFNLDNPGPDEEFVQDNGVTVTMLIPPEVWEETKKQLRNLNQKGG